MTVIPFESGHLRRLALQSAQAYMGCEVAKSEYGESLVVAGPCFTAMDSDGLIACAGIIHQWEGRALAWALLAHDARRAMLPLTRGIGAFLRGCGVRRVETAVDCQFEAAQRWASLLGFRAEGKMLAYTPEGRDCYLYARVR